MSDGDLSYVLLLTVESRRSILQSYELIVVLQSIHRESRGDELHEKDTGTTDVPGFPMEMQSLGSSLASSSFSFGCSSFTSGILMWDPSQSSSFGFLS